MNRKDLMNIRAGFPSRVSDSDSSLYAPITIPFIDKRQSDLYKCEIRVSINDPPEEAFVARELVRRVNGRDTDQLRGLLMQAVSLLDSVAFIKKEGDSAELIEKISAALAGQDTHPYADRPGTAPSTNGFDYENQAWVVDGRYVSCGHPEAMNCGCFGRIHAGESPAASADIH